MTPDKLDDPELDEADAGPDATEASGEDSEQPEHLDLEVSITAPSACERHVTVTISRADIDRYLNDAYSDLMPNAAVPGFRAGRAPRKLVESRFKDEVSEQIKGSLLMDSLSQISEERSFTAISEPDLKLDAVEVPSEGPMTFEFDIEVRPEFDLPQWKGLEIERPVREFTDQDVTDQLEQILAKYGQLTPVDRAVQSGDYVDVHIRSRHDGDLVAHEEDRLVAVRPQLSFLDAQLEGFDTLLAGAKAGDIRQATVTLTQDAPQERLRGQQVELEFEILDVKQIKLPELTEEFVGELGAFESEAELRDAVRANLHRQLEYEQQRKVREQITGELTKTVNFDLPPGLLKRQSARELERAVMELRRAGFSNVELRARENIIRQNSAASTARALKEHFILERIAEEENIEAEEADYELEIMLMARQSGESIRRVRAQIEKGGLMDVLQNQIVERKVLELVQQEARFTDLPYEPRLTTAEAISMAAGGKEMVLAETSEKADAAAKGGASAPDTTHESSH